MSGGTVRPELVVLVDARDVPIGTAPKLDAHRSGARHRAVSVLIVDDAGRLLLQRRAGSKYHSAGLWANSCCGHPRPGEPAIDAAARRLATELGVVCAIEAAGRFEYRAELPNGLVEHEIDHVFVGRWSGTPSPDPTEVAEWRWTTAEALRHDLARHPERYAAWLAGVLEHAARHPLLASR